MVRIIALLLIFCSPSLAAQWYSTPKAEYHMAEVTVHNGTNGAGSGTVIKVDNDDIYVITAKHVVDFSHPRPYIVWQNGVKTPMRVRAVSAQHDISVLHTNHTWANWEKIPVIPVASKEPPSGAVMEILGFGVDGNGGDDLRHFYAKLRGANSMGHFEYETSVVSGDSGGGVVYERELVGVIWGGNDRSREGYVYPAQSATYQQVVSFLAQSCPDCLPFSRPLFGEGRGGMQIPSTPPPSIETPPAQQNPPAGSGLADIGDRIGKLEDEVKSLGVTVNGLQFQNNAITDGLGDKVKELDTEVSSVKGKTTELEGEVASTKSEFREELGDILKGAKDAAVHSVSERIGPTFFISLAGALGIAGAPGLIVGFLGWRLAKRIANRIGGSEVPRVPFPTTPRPIPRPPTRPVDTQCIERVRDLENQLRECYEHQNPDLSRELQRALDHAAHLQQKVQEGHSREDELREAIDRLKETGRLAEAKIRQYQNTRREYVAVPTRDLEAEAYKEALKRVVNNNPRSEPVVRQIESVANQIFHGSKVELGHPPEPNTRED